MENSNSIFVKVALVGCFLLFVISAIIAYNFHSQLVALRKNPQQIVQDEVKTIVMRVSRHMILPEGETPTLATVTDPMRLKDQPFFAKTKIGDKVLIYATAKKAILYDPVNDRIVEVAPLTIGNPAPEAPKAPAPAQPPKQ